MTAGRQYARRPALITRRLKSLGPSWPQSSDPGTPLNTERRDRPRTHHYPQPINIHLALTPIAIPISHAAILTLAARRVANDVNH